MEIRPKRKNIRILTRLISILAAGLLLHNCSTQKVATVSSAEKKPIILVMPVYTRGPGLPDMMDLTESIVYALKSESRYEPLDVGESVAIVKKYKLRGIFPSREEISKVGLAEKIDFLLIVSISSLSEAGESIQFETLQAKTIEIRLRLFNAKSGKLKQVLHQQKRVTRTLRDCLSDLIIENIYKL